MPVAHFGAIPMLVRGQSSTAVSSRLGRQAEPFSSARQSISMILRRETEFPDKPHSAGWHPNVCLSLRCCGRGLPSGLSGFVERRSVLSRTSKSRSEDLRCRRSSPSRTSGCSKSSRAECGTARGAGASDRDVRGARHHQPLADRRAAGARCHCRERGAGLWDR